jgi:Domain of unknown function (DUF4440)
MPNCSAPLRAIFLASLLALPGRAAVGTQSSVAGQADAPVDLAALRVVSSGIIARDNTGDAAAVIRFYADDAVLLPPNGAPVVGKGAILERYEEGFRHFRFAIPSTSEETHVCGDWAFDRGITNGKTIPTTSESPKTNPRPIRDDSSPRSERRLEDCATDLERS